MPRAVYCAAVIAALSAAVAFGGGAAAAPRLNPAMDSVTATLSNAHAGARPVTLTLALRTELQCGRLVGSTLTVRLPAQERMPATVAATSVLVAGKAAAAAALAGHTITISILRPHTIMCDVIGPGTVTIVLTRTANLGNPKAAGSYPLVVARGAQQFKTLLKII